MSGPLSLLRPIRVSALRVLASVRDRQLPSEIVLTLDGVSVRFRLGTHVEYEQFRNYATGPDATVLRDFFGRLTERDVCWDVGANVGVFTCFAAEVVPPDQVVAIEPHPKNVDRLRENLDLNDQDGLVYQVALADEPGTETLLVSTRDVDGAFGTLDSNGDVRVDAIRGDDLRTERAVPPPTVVKIDVQGGEGAIVDGSRRILSREDCRLVYCNVYEKHRPSSPTPPTVDDQLCGLGFDVDRVADWSGGYFLRGVREDSGSHR
jgi:FkbM family methyltransferase